MQPNHLNRFDVVGGTGTDRGILPEAELWTAVILQTIEDHVVSHQIRNTG
jgi:hypothetical protein